MMISGERLQVVGHRGWRTRYPDNTLLGIEACVGVADMVEIDIRRTADGRLVLSHDPELVGRVVSECDWSQLADLDVGEGHPPVLLDDVLSALPDLPLNLEVKNDPAEPGFEDDHRLGLDAAARARPGDLLTSFWWPTVDAVRRMFPHVETGLLAEPSTDLDPLLGHAVEERHVAVVPHWSMLDAAPEFIAEAHRRGLRVVAWTVNDPAVAVRLAEAGLDAIITDDPGLMAETLGGSR